MRRWFTPSSRVLFVALILAHIYIGTIGMEGAFEAMGEGSVDRNWAKEHHSLWLEEQMARRCGDRRASGRHACRIIFDVTSHALSSSDG